MCSQDPYRNLGERLEAIQSEPGKATVIYVSPEEQKRFVDKMNAVRAAETELIREIRILRDAHKASVQTFIDMWKLITSGVEGGAEYRMAALKDRNTEIVAQIHITEDQVDSLLAELDAIAGAK